MAVLLRKIKDPTFSTEIYLMIASYRDMTKYLDKRYTYKIGDAEYYPAGRVIKAFHTRKTWRTTRYFLWLNKFDYYGSEYATLVHEVIHLALMVFEQKGIPIIFDQSNGNEAFCYYTDYLFERFLNAIRRIKEIDYKSCKEAMDYMKNNGDLIGKSKQI